MSDTRTITLTDRRPVLIQEEDWPVLATGSANDIGRARTIRVRQHQDARLIVYGSYDYDGYRVKHGVLLVAPNSTCPNMLEGAVRDVGAWLRQAEIDDPDVNPDYETVAAVTTRWRKAVQECIASLPAETL